MTRTSGQSWSALLALAVALPLLACGGSSGGAKADAGKADGGKADGAKAADDGAKAADDAKSGDELHVEPAEAGDEAADEAAPAEAGNDAAAEAGAEDTGAAAEGGSTAAAAEGGADEGEDEGKDDEGGGESTGAAGPDKKALLAEVAKKKTKDERANEALAEAEAAGATEKELAQAAHKRGKALFATPERAKAFFEYALDKDKKYPDPVFELAKQEVNTSELDAAKAHLEEVKKRGGKKLLGQIDYDPMWDVLKDDPDVRALIDG